MASRSRAQVPDLARSAYPTVILRWLTICGLILLVAACSSATPTTIASPSSYGTFTPNWSTPEATIAPVELSTTVSQQSATSIFVGYTHQQADGNRIVVGSGQLPNLTPLDIPLPGPASWVVAIPWQDGSLWVVTLADGQVLGFMVDAQGWQPFEIRPPNLEAGQPPLFFGSEAIAELLTSPIGQVSPYTHPIPIDRAGLNQIFIDISGNLILVDDNLREYSKITANALPDARILSDEDGRLLFLSNPSKDYGHGVLGDAIEATSITRIDDPQSGEISAVISVREGFVIEGLAPIWADLNGDGEREIIVTVSNAQQGAQILIFSEAGQQIAAGPSIGQGFRWRHQIAVAPFGSNGEIELVDVLTPHLGGVVEFYQWVGDQLNVVARLPGYTSHVIGTRNLDMAAAGDFDGDGRVELLLPNQARTELGAIRRTPDGAGTEAGAEVVWSLPLDGQMTSNLGAVTLLDGSNVIGIGQENGILLPAGNSLRIWRP